MFFNRHLKANVCIFLPARVIFWKIVQHKCDHSSSAHSEYLVHQLLFEQWYFLRSRTLCEFFTPANRCIVLRWDPYIRSSSAVDPQQETVLPRGCTDYAAAEGGSGRGRRVGRRIVLSGCSTGREILDVLET